MALKGEDLARLSPDAQRQIYLKTVAAQRERSAKRKYNNQPTERNGIKFDSRKEAKRYEELMFLRQAGEIDNLKLQPQFTLQESYMTPEGERIRAIRYVADFSYTQGSQMVVEDVKSKATATAQNATMRAVSASGMSRRYHPASAHTSTMIAIFKTASFVVPSFFAISVSFWRIHPLFLADKYQPLVRTSSCGNGISMPPSSNARQIASLRSKRTVQ